MANIDEKYEILKEYLKELNSVAVAFSGGVDSTFLLKAAHDVLGHKTVAVTAKSLSFPERELKEACQFTADQGIAHILVDSEELDIEGFAENPPNRCYLCKKELFEKIGVIAEEQGLSAIVEGSNTDDDGDYRPGLTAVKELGVKSPLRYARLSKEEIRQLSKAQGLPTWDKQSFACLSSRFPFGETIDPQKLSMIDKAEQFLLDKGLYQVRVRVHGDAARIETAENGFAFFADTENRREVHRKLKEIGFSFVALDLGGYQTGSMNATLKENNLFV